MEADVAKGRRDWAFSERDKVRSPVTITQIKTINKLFNAILCKILLQDLCP